MVSSLKENNSVWGKTSHAFLRDVMWSESFCTIAILYKCKRTSSGRILLIDRSESPKAGAYLRAEYCGDCNTMFLLPEVILWAEGRDLLRSPSTSTDWLAHIFNKKLLPLFVGILQKIFRVFIFLYNLKFNRFWRVKIRYYEYLSTP